MLQQHVGGEEDEPLECNSYENDDSYEGAMEWFGKHPDKRQQKCLDKCANPRCFGIGGRKFRLIPCNHCDDVAYCSVDCKAAHWNADPPNGHQYRCVRTKVSPCVASSSRAVSGGQQVWPVYVCAL